MEGCFGCKAKVGIVTTASRARKWGMRWRPLESSKIIAACGERDYEVGPRGGRWFEEMGIDVDLLRGGRRAFARQCLDWTERTPHLAGALGAALYLRLCELGWIAQRPKTRAVRVTHRGARELHSQFGITA